ncbi:hypothetical protein JR316_0001335 [Psilocybe cubensis]|uniref:Uncharacterized protein n=2 Tax=Psilocybe cubensis TaxID=181762 RepID=A0A8H7Y8G7_PSICU|nr:hypothetical protein JR316_0001335 [Psilocybe cubensis]KAH9487265.1 hypothetical protein JR316_0001335 [Psilocybe cubensis]
MPVATARRTATTTSSSLVNRTTKSSRSTKLHSISEAQVKAWSEALKARNAVNNNEDERELDDEDEYPFKDQDLVWVRTKGAKWVYGKVSGGPSLIRAGRTRYSKEGLFYPVKFGDKLHLRKYFAPTNGDIKLDTKAVRRSMIQEGLIDGDTTDDDDGTEALSDPSDSSYVD